MILITPGHVSASTSTYHLPPSVYGFRPGPRWTLSRNAAARAHPSPAVKKEEGLQLRLADAAAMDHLAIPQHTTIVAHLHTVSSFENLASGRSTPARSRSATRERSRIRSKMLDVATQRADPSTSFSWTPAASVSHSVRLAALLIACAILLQLDPPNFLSRLSWLFDPKRTYRYSQRPRLVHDSDSEVARDWILDMQHAVLLTVVGTMASSFERLSELYLAKVQNNSRDLR
ncbi:hypothetical protein BST61_g3394 [Cercospora zeina]